jgi:hypothetical protein
MSSHESYFAQNPGRLAVGDPAQRTAEAVSALIQAARKRSRTVQAARKRSRTVQWMPEGTRGCRFEIIVVDSGAYEAIAHIDGNTGAMRLEAQ